MSSPYPIIPAYTHRISSRGQEETQLSSNTEVLFRIAHDQLIKIKMQEHMNIFLLFFTTSGGKISFLGELATKPGVLGKVH